MPLQRNPVLERFHPDVKIPERSQQYLELIKSHLTDPNRTCRLCNRWKGRNGQALPVPGEGFGRLMLIGHRIGRNEANDGRPSIGNASRVNFSLLCEALAPEVDIPKQAARDVCLDFCYVTNHTRCDPGEDAKPSHREVKTCSENWLKQEIKRVDPIVLVFWHRSSAKSILKMGPPGNGQMFTANVYGTKRTCMVMNHPVVIERSTKPQTYRTQILSQYQSLAKWLYEEGWIDQLPDGAPSSGHETEHLLIQTEDELEACVNDLWDNPFVALDTETSMRRRVGDKNAYEEEKGALLWTRRGFEPVTVQLAGVDYQDDGTPFVDKSYTITTGFRDVAGRLQHELTPESVSDHLNRLFAHAPASTGVRYVAMWNALFDSPVMTRMGVDLLGFTRWDFPVQIWDGMLVDGRMNEHLTFIGGLGLGSASQRRGHGSKDSFNKNFDVRRFARLDLSNPDNRKRLLEYAGSDPTKTLLTVHDALSELSEHHYELDPDGLNFSRSSVPPVGYSPFPEMNRDFSGFRLKDVSIPMDHQMIPVISQMKMIGFRLNMDRYDELETYVKRQEQRLLQDIRDLGYGWLKPNSGPDTLRVLKATREALAETANALYGQVSASHLFQAMDIDMPRSLDGFSFTEERVEGAFESIYGELSAQQDAVKKFLSFTEAVHGKLLVLAEGTGIDVDGLLPPIDELQELFDTVFLYKQLGKKWSTYFIRFREIADEHGVIHPDYKLTGTTSGRLSGNFQNIPRGDDSNEILQQLDVRQFLEVVSAEDLNRTFDEMGLEAHDGTAFQIEDKPYVGVFADFAGQEDRMAFAQTGDATKARLLSDPDMDTHFYNAAFLFGAGIERPENGVYEEDDPYSKEVTGETQFSTETPEDVMEVYKYFTDQSTEKKAKRYKRFKKNYRTPVKTVHYARQFGAADQKIHNLLLPIMRKQGRTWTLEDTKRLTQAYDELYAGVTQARQEIMDQLDQRPFVEYPLYGTIRHAEHLDGKVVDNEYLSVANANNQGTSAGITKHAMLRMRRLIYENAHRWDLVEVGGDNFVGICLQVHDEIGVVCPAEIALDVVEVLESAMRVWVGPTEGEDALPEDAPYEHEDGTFGADARWHENGCLYMPDAGFEAPVLFDADAEIKPTIAKADVLDDGRQNLLADSLKPKTLEAFAQQHPQRVNEAHDLVTGYAADGKPPA